jgi:hypothetical protein
VGTRQDQAIAFNGGLFEEAESRQLLTMLLAEECFKGNATIPVWLTSMAEN